MRIPKYISPERLIEAINKGNVDVVNEFATSNILLQEKEWKGGYRFLNIALSNKEFEIARILLNKVTVVNSEKTYDTTPLHYAAMENKIDIIKQLLDKGAAVDAIDDHDMTPLHYGVILEHLETVEILLDYGANSNDVKDHVFRFTPFQHACNSSKHLILKSFLDRGSMVNTVFEYPDTLICPKGSSPLHMAILQKNVGSIHLLLERNADVNHMNYNRETCLHLASREDNIGIVRLLIENNVQIDVKAKDNTTPLHIAVKNGNAEIVELLLLNGASTENQDKEGKIPLQRAVEQRYSKIVDCLLGIHPDHTNGSYRAAFKSALLETGFQSDIFKCFVKHGFVPSQHDICEVLFSAIKKGYFHIVETILDPDNRIYDNNIFFSAKNEEGDTLLHSATKNKQHDIVRLLISKNFDVNALNNEGNPAILYAIKNDDKQIVRTFFTEGSGAKNWPLILHVVIQTKKEKSGTMLELILRHEVDVDQHHPELDGMTPLHLICKEPLQNDVNLANLLLRRGANVNVTTNDGSTALHLVATRSDGINILKTLLEFEPRTDICDKFGSTPLHYAAAKARSKIVSALLDEGASINIQNNIGMTPVDVIFSIKNRPAERLPELGADGEVENDELEVNESIILLQQHAIKLFVSGQHLNANNKKYITDSERNFKCKCEREIEEIKRLGINSNVSFYDVLTRNVRRVVRYTSEGSARNNLEFADFRMRYPIYGNLLDYAKKIVMREYEMNKAKDAISILSGYGLPDMCTENILVNLRTIELKNLVLASRTIC